MSGKLIKPSDFKQPSAESLVQVVKAEHGNSEISCVIDQDPKGISEGNSHGIHCSRPSAYTFANMAVQTNESMSSVGVEVPSERKKTIDSHLWFAKTD